MRNAFVYGAGYLGQQVFHHLIAYFSDSINVLGFVDDVRSPGERVLGSKHTLGNIADASSSSDLNSGKAGLVFAIGYSSMLARRAALERVISLGYQLISVVHPRAIIEPGAVLGLGSIVLGGAIIDQQVKTGPACFIDIGVRLGAGTTIGTNNYFSSGTCTGSRVFVADNCFFGMNCTITTDVKVGSNVFVNAAALVPRDVGDNVKVVELRKAKELPQR